MRGYPSTLNSWEDVIFVTENFPKDMWQADLERLISDDETKAWYWVELLPVGKAGIVDDTHKVVEYDVNKANEGTSGTASGTGTASGDGTATASEDDSESNEIQYVQYELRYNLLCRLGQMKFCQTDAELVAAIADVQNLLNVNEATAETGTDGTATTAETGDSAETAETTKTTKKSTKSTKTTK